MAWLSLLKTGNILFHRYVKNGLLTLNWGENEEIYLIEGIGFE